MAFLGRGKSDHEIWVFTTAGIPISLVFIQTYAVSRRLRNDNGRITPENPAACSEVSRLSKAVLWSGNFWVLTLHRAALAFEIAIFPRSILVGPLPCILSDEDCSHRLAVAIIGFSQPNRLPAPATNAVVRHKLTP